MLVRDIYGRGLTRPAIGLELELESSKRQDLAWMEQKNTMWVAHSDGSLRQNGVEYVFAQPYFGGDISAALAQFEDNTKKTPFVPSLNGSTHVHYNVGHLLVTEVMNIVTAWAILEDAFLSLCHPSRTGNLFTLRFSDANNLTQTLQSGLRTGGVENIFVGFSIDNWKYLNLNLASIRQFGTIEFRCYHSTHNIEEIQSWINRLINFCELATKFKSPSHLLEEAERDIHSFAIDLAGVSLTDELLDRIRRNISTAFRLAFVTTEWEDIDAYRKSPPPKTKKQPAGMKKATPFPTLRDVPYYTYISEVRRAMDFIPPQGRVGTTGRTITPAVYIEESVDDIRSVDEILGSDDEL